VSGSFVRGCSAVVVCRALIVIRKRCLDCLMRRCLNGLIDLCSKIVELEEELRVVGNNLKSLEVSEEKVNHSFILRALYGAQSDRAAVN